MFAPSTVRAIATPGKTTNHHGGWNDCARTPPSMLPRLGVGGGTPTPRKLSAASAKIAEPRLTVAITATGARHCGAIWRIMIRGAVAPTHRAASTNCICLTESTTDRVTRVASGIWVIPTATITVPNPGPNATDRSMARISVGNEVRTSIKRWLSRSYVPATYPLLTPQTTPTETPSAIEATLTTRLIRKPY